MARTGFLLSYELYSFACRDLSTTTIGLQNAGKFKKDITKWISKFASPGSTKKLFCFVHTVSNSNHVPGWNLFDIQKEFTRQGVNMNHWRISEANVGYKICQEYPSLLVVPNQIKDQDVCHVGQARYRGKIPALVWGNNNGALLLRSSQLHYLSDDLTFSGVGQNKNDIAFLRQILTLSGKENVHVVELGTEAAFSPIRNLYTGFYSDRCVLKFLNLPNETVLIESLRGLSTFCISGSLDKFNEIENPELMKWLTNCNSFLIGVTEILKSIEEGPVMLQSYESTIVPCISALTQLILDPYYRTIEGFCILIEKDFIYYGHKFYTLAKKRDDENSSVFLLFIDCAWQIMQKYPLSFEFQESLLLFIVDSVYSCQYGSFLPCCEKDKADYPKKTPSIWSFILTNQSRFINSLYVEKEKLQNVQFDKSQIRLWSSFYLRHRFRTSLLKVERSLQTAVAKNVYSLELSSLKIPFFHTNDSNLNHVTSVNLQGNIISQIPLTLINLPNLRRLCLEDNRIPFLPLDFLDLYTKAVTTLEELNFKNNQIKEMNECIGRFQELKILNIHGNLLHKFPDVSKFSKLQELDIGANNITVVPASIFEMKSLVLLDISLNPISILPNEISSLINLRRLNISSTNIQVIPNQISLLTNLVSLDISNNSMKSEGNIPEIIFTFSQLEELGVAGLNIAEIPIYISKFANLQILDMVNNRIAILPEELLRLSKLKILKLSHNQLTSIPLEISKLDQLIELHLNNNKLQALTPGVGKLDKLRLLNISTNKIKHIPGTIGYLKSLEESQLFTFDHNPNLKTPPDIIIQQGYSATFEFLRGLLTGEEKIYRMKIMMVGQENVGKTSIVRCLKASKTGKPIPDNAYIEDMEMYKRTGLTSKSTDGISIGNLDFKDKKQLVELSVWDFGGQEIYYTTHQFFLSDRALYILVWNVAKKEEDSRVEYWLKSINARAPNAPIIIVATHIDDPICTKEYLNETIKAIENKYFQQFPSIQNVCPVSCKSGHGILELNLWIQSIVLRQKFMGEIIPKTFAELEKLVKQEKKKIVPPVVSWKELEAMGVMCNIKSSNTLFTAAQWLHNLGTIINFQKQKGLEDVVILDPQWLTDVMSTIVTFQHRFIKNGVLNHGDLPQLWTPPKFPQRLHKTLLNLLEKFEISYYLRSTRQQPLDGTEPMYTGKSLVPSLLPEERPSEIERIWPHFPSAREEQFSRRYKFGFIPHGFVSRLMVRVLHFAEPTICWRYGMLVEKTTNTTVAKELSVAEQEFEGNFSILVEAQPAQRIVDVIIRGSEGKKLAQLIIESINSLIDGWYSVSVEILIPCIHCIREKNYQPYFFNIQDCEQAAIDGKSFIKCANIRDIRLDEVVPDIAMTHVQNCKLTYSELNVEKEIGQGGFATVFKGVYQDKVVAIKRIKFGDSAQVSLDDTTELQAFSEFRREVWIMSGLVHSNIVQMAGFTMDPFCIITEYIPCGNLYDLIHDKSLELSWNYRWRCALDIAKGMNYLHTTSWPPIIHRDLKSPNVLMSSLDERAEMVAKVADFGLSQALASTTKGRSVANPVWLAPEIIQNQDYTEKADVYSYGVCFPILYIHRYIDTHLFLPLFNMISFLLFSLLFSLPFS